MLIFKHIIAYLEMEINCFQNPPFKSSIKSPIKTKRPPEGDLFVLAGAEGLVSAQRRKAERDFAFAMCLGQARL